MTSSQSGEYQLCEANFQSLFLRLFFSSVGVNHFWHNGCLIRLKILQSRDIDLRDFLSICNNLIINPHRFAQNQAA